MCGLCKAIKDYSFCPNGPDVNLYSEIPINLWQHNPPHKWMNHTPILFKKENPSTNPLIGHTHVDLGSKIRDPLLFLHNLYLLELDFRSPRLMPIKTFLSPIATFASSGAQSLVVGNPGENGQIILWSSPPLGLQPFSKSFPPGTLKVWERRRFFQGMMPYLGNICQVLWPK